MGLPEQWVRDERVFDSVNALGTRSVVEAAVRAGVRRVIHTSTIDVFHAEPGGSFDESELAGYPKGTAYERSKQRAEELAYAAAEGSDTELVIVNPSAVYGPGPGGDATSLEESLLRPVLEGRRAELPALPPGGMGLVHSAGLGKGQLLVAERGVPGERYILCDGHMTFRETRGDRGAARRTRQRPAGHAGAGGQGAGRRGRAGGATPWASRRCCRAGSCTSSSGTRTLVRTRRSGSSAGSPPRSWTGCAIRSRPLAEIRRTRDDDAAEAARLLHVSAADMYDRFSGGRERALQALERALVEPGNAASAECVWLAEIEGEPAGAMAAFPVDEAADRSRAFMRLALRGSPPWRWPGALRLYWIGGRASPNPPSAAFYIDSLATDERFRRRGVARALLAEAERRARAHSLPCVALDTTLTNEAARALYASEGFDEVAYRPAAHGLPGFVALVKPLEGVSPP